MAVVHEPPQLRSRTMYRTRGPAGWTNFAAGLRPHSRHDQTARELVLTYDQRLCQSLVDDRRSITMPYVEV